jgi:O-antigen ligase
MIIVSFNIIFLIAIIQLFDIPFLNDFIKFTYNDIKLRSLLTNYPRIYSTFYNPNWFGSYLIFFISWINSKITKKSINFIIYLLLLLMAINLIIFSGSRTSLIGLIVVFISQLLNRNDHFFKYISFILGIFIFFLIFFQFNQYPQIWNLLFRFTDFIQLLFSGQDISSYDGRFISWERTLLLIIYNPFFGIGSADFIPHNSYLYLFLNFGLFFGSITFVIILISFILLLRKVKKLNYNNYHFIITLSLSLFTISFFGEFLFTTQVVLSFFLFFADSLADSINYSEKTQNFH